MIKEKNTPCMEIRVREAAKEGIFSWMAKHFGAVARASIVAISLFLVQPAIDATARLFFHAKGKPSTILVAQDKSKKREGKILGSENFEKVELKDGILYIIGIRADVDKKTDVTVGLKDLRQELTQNKHLIEKKLKEEMPLGIFVTLDLNREKTAIMHVTVNLVYEEALFRISRNLSSSAIHSQCAIPADDSKIFLHDGAIFISKNGSIVATTPTTLLIITPDDVVSVAYKRIFEVDINLKKPYIKKGKNDDYVDLFDETLKTEDGQNVKFEIALSKGKITPRLVLPPVGER